MPGVSTATFLTGIEIGLAVAMPIGPMGLLCIQRTLSFGLLAGLVTGLAAATVQVTYSAIAALGLGATAQTWVGSGATFLSLASALLLLWFALRIMSRRLVISAGPTQELNHLARFYGGGLVVGFTNPMAVLLLLAAVPALASGEEIAVIPALVGGVFAGASSWYLALTTVVTLVRERLSVRALEITNVVAALLLAGMGLFMFVNAIQGLFWPSRPD
jgi:threonine/homoserine/homoserine lactone efflux protein